MTEQTTSGPRYPWDEGEGGPISEAGAQLKAGRPVRAVRLLEELVKREPHNPVVHRALADALFWAGRYGAASRSARQALQLDPTMPGPNETLAHVALRGKHPTNALVHFQAELEALRRHGAPDSEHARVYNGLGNAYLFQNQLDEAEAAFRRAVMLDSQWDGHHMVLALFYQRFARWDEARVALERLLGLPEISDDVAARAHFQLGSLYARQGRNGQAREQFARSLQRRRSWGAYLYRLWPALSRFSSGLGTAGCMLLMTLVSVLLCLLVTYLVKG